MPRRTPQCAKEESAGVAGRSLLFHTLQLQLSSPDVSCVVLVSSAHLVRVAAATAGSPTTCPIADSPELMFLWCWSDDWVQALGMGLGKQETRVLRCDILDCHLFEMFLSSLDFFFFHLSPVCKSCI